MVSKPMINSEINVKFNSYPDKQHEKVKGLIEIGRSLIR